MVLSLFLLSLTMDEKFDFGEHIKASLAKSNKMIAWVSRNVIYKDREVKGEGEGPLGSNHGK